MANFPSAVSTAAQLGVAVNNLSTTLSDSPLSSGATTVNVASTTGFPTAGWITIDTEVILYTGVTGTSFTTCTRGADGTSAASHTLGATVSLDVIAVHHNSLKDEIIALETKLVDSGNPTFAIISASGGVRPTSNAACDVGSSSLLFGSVNCQTLVGGSAGGGLGTLRLYPTTGSKGYLTLVPVENTGNTVTTVTHAAQAAARTYTIPDAGADANFVMTQGAQTLVGVKTFSDQPSATAGIKASIAGGSDVLDLNGSSSGTVNIRLAPTTASGNAARIRGSASTGGTNTNIEFLTTAVSRLTIDGDSGDIYTTTWTDYSGTSTITGWASFSAKQLYYKKVGKLVFVAFRLDGTSNSTSTTFTLPFAVDSAISVEVHVGRAVDSGARVDAAVVQSSASTTTFFKDSGGTTWTATGTKTVWGQFWYQAA